MVARRNDEGVRIEPLSHLPSTVFYEGASPGVISSKGDRLTPGIGGKVMGPRASPKGR